VKAGATAALLILTVALAGPGCGGEGSETTSSPGRATTPTVAPPPAVRPQRRVLIAALGDSITAGSPLWDPDAAVQRRILELNPQSQFEFWARRRLGPNAVFRNCGVFGETTRQIAARFDRCAQGAQVLIVQGGINDVYRPIKVEQSAANLRQMVQRGRAAGLRVALADVLPWNNGYPRFADKIKRLNVLIAGVAREEGVELLPFHATLEDPDNPGRMRPEWTIDGDHPSVIGYRRLGEVVELP